MSSREERQDERESYSPENQAKGPPLSSLVSSPSGRLLEKIRSGRNEQEDRTSYDVKPAPATSSELVHTEPKAIAPATDKDVKPRVELAPVTSSEMVHSARIHNYRTSRSEPAAQRSIPTTEARASSTDEPAGVATISTPGAFHVDGIGSIDGNRITTPSPLSNVPSAPNVDNSSHLIPTAFLVPEEDEKEVVIAEKAPLCNANKKCASVVVGAVVFVVAGVVLGIVFGIGSSRTESTDVEYTRSSLMQLVVSASHDGGVAISNPTSPHAAAYEWLWADPSLSRYTDARILERYALATLYFSTAGDGWRNNTSWMSYEVSECHWAWVTCNYEGKIERLLMDQSGLPKGNKLKGTIPDDIFHHLNDLFELDLSNNYGLKGTLPEDLGNSLAWFRIHDCSLTGTLPSAAFLRLTHLRSIHFHRNHLEGTLPDLWHLEDLQTLRLSDNRLTGTLSSGIGDLINLESLWLSRNHLIGSLPSEIGQLLRLDELYCSYNNLTGTIPSDLGKLIKMGE